MLFTTTSPVSELVWSPHEGLIVKYASPSTTGKKTAFWCSESFNIEFLSEDCVDNSGTGHCAADDVDSMQSKLNNCAEKLSQADHSGKADDDVQLVSVTRMQEQGSGSCGENMKLVDITNKTSVKDELHSNCSVEKENEIRVTGNTEDCIPDGVTAGQDNNSPGSASCGLKVFVEKRAECAANDITLICQSEVLVGGEKYQKSGRTTVSSFEDSVLPGNDKSLVSMNSPKHGSDVASDDMPQIMRHSSNFALHGQRCSDIVPLNIESTTKLDKFVPLVSQDGGGYEAEEVVRKDYLNAICYESEPELKNRTLEKGKQKILGDEQDYCSISKQRKENDESAESTNSRKIISRGKRAWNFESASLACKKLKKEHKEGTSSESLIRKDTSFLNWMSSLTNGFSGFHDTMPSLTLLPQSSSVEERLGSIPTSENNKGAVYGAVGFTSIFQSLYSPSAVLQNNLCSHDPRKEEGAMKEPKKPGNHPVSNSQALNFNSLDDSQEKSHSSARETDRTDVPAIGSPCEGEGGELGAKEIGKCTDHIETHPSVPFNMSSTDNMVCGKIEQKIGESCAPMVIQPLRCLKMNIVTRDEGNRNQNMGINGSSFFENSWIARFLRKDSASILNSEGHRLGVDSETVKLNNDDNYLEDNFCPDRITSDREPHKADNFHDPHLESQGIAVTGDLQQFPISPTDSCGSRRPEDQKIKPNISPIMPSKIFRRSEPIASIFAKRLDALRHIMPSRVSDSLTHSATICLFCGRPGHSLRKCSALVESDLKNLLEFVKSYEENDTPACFCIRCFQVGHWAIACPHAASKKENCDHSCVPDKNVKMVQAKPEHDRRIVLWTEDGSKEHEQNSSESSMPQQGNSRHGSAGPIDKRSCNMDQLAVSMADDLVSIQAKGFQSKSKFNVEIKNTSYPENDSRETEVIPPCKFVATELTSRQKEIFDAIKKLRLSRTDIMRWMKSPSAHLSLEGFFLRLRLGKWDEGLGGTGYHVARINGGNCENNFSVSIGRITCLVDCRFVSNHDYIEDELKAWCTATLKSDGKLPSQEELEMKFQERMQLGI